MSWSGQELIAFNTGEQDGIFGRPRDNPYNIVPTPRSHRAYEEGYDEGEGSTIPPRGPAGVPGPQGDPGSQGIPGLNGQDGADGLAFLQGVGVPDSGLGKPGDTYLDLTTNEIYNKTGVSTWELTSLSLATNVDDEGTLIYIGDAAAGTLSSAASWRVKRITITVDGGGRDDTVTEFADGDALFDNVYDDRASLSYS